MRTLIKRIGNSRGIIIPASILKVLNIKESEPLLIKIVGREIILTKEPEFNPKSLNELFVGYDKRYEEKIVFADDKGLEKW